MTININDKQKSNWLADHKISLKSVVNPHFSKGEWPSGQKRQTVNLLQAAIPPEALLTYIFKTCPCPWSWASPKTSISSTISFDINRPIRGKTQSYRFTILLKLFIFMSFFNLSLYPMVSDRCTVTIIV